MKRLSHARSIPCTIALVFVLAASGCLRQQYQFKVHAPAAYPESLAIGSIEIKPFDLLSGQGRSEAMLLGQYIETGVANQGHLKVVKTDADAVLTGQINFGKIQEKTHQDKNKSLTETLVAKALGDDGKKDAVKYVYQKSLVVTGSYSLFYRKENRVVLGNPIQIDYNNEWTSYDSYQEAKAQAPTNDQLMGGVLRIIADDIVSKVTPHEKTVKRYLESGDDERLKLGSKFLIHGRADQALELWDAVIRDSADPEEKARAYYNIGIVKEAQGDYGDAFALFSEASMLSLGNDLYLEAMSRVEKEKVARDRMRQQTGGGGKQ